MENAAALVDALRAVVGADHVLTAADLRARYERDWTGRYLGAASAVVRPAATDEVAGVLAWCDANGVVVVPQGGNTGLVAGGVPVGEARGAVVLSTQRLRDRGPVDTASAQVTVGAGVTIAELDALAATAGLAFGVDFGARDSATIGGAVATNAGGLRALRFGMVRDQLRGFEAVLADGRVVADLRGLVKDNTGYAMGQLLCGSEGTLAVVTAARLALVPRYANRATALVGFVSWSAAVAAAAMWRTELADLDALEVVRGPELAAVATALGAPDPLGARWPVTVLVECAAHDDPTQRLAAALEATSEVGEVVVAADDLRRRHLWRLRDELTAVIGRHGSPHKLDVTVPLGAVAEFVDALVGLVAEQAPAARLWLFGHLGDGNLHVNLTGLDPDDVSVDDAILRLVASRGGSISAEHGIGRAKAGALHLRRDPVQLEVFGALKAALDPRGTLNPGVLLDRSR